MYQRASASLTAPAVPCTSSPMNNRRSRVLPLVSLVSLVFLTLGLAARADWRDKVAPRLLEGAPEATIEFLVVLEEQAELGFARDLRDKADRGRAVREALRATAVPSQRPLLARLREAGADTRPFWIVNMVLVRGGRDLLPEIARRADVRRIEANPTIRGADPLPAGGEPPPAPSGGIEWNVARVSAPTAWAAGFDGSGVVIGGQDTGYEFDHPALLARYRGSDGASVSHDHNWHDAIHAGGGVCGADSPIPCDDHDHGTHTMGTMIGDDGAANRVGVAPGARWIGCRNMDQGNGTPATYAECFEWFLAPTDLAGNDPDPALAPHVINNSWGCPPFEGCAADTLEAVVDAVRAAGIVVVASAGNSGSGCGSVDDPPAIYASSFSVGATDADEEIAWFSSRGPVTVDGSNRPKPDVSAPGVGVRSAIRGGGYASFNGTSMAGPHVAGVVALLLDARPDLVGDVDTIEAVIERSALPRTSAETCGGVPGETVPNNTFGWGRVDAAEVLFGDADTDGTDNLADCRPADASAWAVPGPAHGLVVGPSSLTWSPPRDPGSATVLYDVVRSGAPDGFAAAACVGAALGVPSAADPTVPETGFFYLVRSRNGCGSSLAADSAGNARSAVSCFAGR